MSCRRPFRSDGDQDLLHVDGLASREDSLPLRADEVPRLLPALARRLPQSGWVLFGHQGAIAVVVELNHLRSPQDDGGELAGEHEIDRAEKRVGPRVDGAEWSGGPVVSAGQLRHLTCAAYLPSSE